MNGKYNISIGLISLGVFMAYGFLLIYLRDFAPNKDQWIADYGLGKHFETRLAHVHGNLFAFLNIMVGYLLMQFHARIRQVKLVAWLGLLGMLMPLGILAEVYLSAPPIFVLIGAIAMTASVVVLGVQMFKLKNATI